MKLGKKFLIVLIIFTLTAGTLVGTALAGPSNGKCPCTSPDDPCGEDDNCCGCADYLSTCETCEEDENCDTSSATYYPGKGWWRDAKCVPC